MTTARLLSKVITGLLLCSAITISACGRATQSAYQNSSNPLASTPLEDSSSKNLNNFTATEPVTGMGSVVGRVVDASGQGLPNVTVNIGSVSATSNMTGDFQLNNIPAGQKTMSLNYGNRQITATVTVIAETAAIPDLNPIQFSNNGTGGSGLANTQLKTFKVDQDFLNQWQAESVAAVGGTIYVAVTDTSGLFKNGSIISIDSETGKIWKNLGKKWLGLRYPIDKTVKAVAVNGSNLVAVGEKGNLYNIENKQTIKSFKSGAGVDIAVGKGVIYVSTGTAVEKSDNSGQTRSLVKDFSVNAGICTDTSGNLYGLKNNVVKKLKDGEVVDVVTKGIEGGIDVAVDEKNDFVYVLEASVVKRFSLSTGSIQVTFGTGAVKPTSISVDEMGNVYVSDRGKDYKNSKIVKFAPGNGATGQFQNQDFLKSQQNFEGTGETASTEEPSTATTEDSTDNE